ncbi:sporulation protein [Peribacillus simplex]|uniref:sporulation protein n=1 Tax=Peribacillus simplex TaxID=1478 RepID=UPI00298E7EDA|nr:sporulation protein [Peribacillus simplex]MDW7614349.1 sporulation protein [Peribacillus simplex]
MLLRRYLSQLGIGKAVIDLKLPKVKYGLGERIRGEFSIIGGICEQKIKRLECDLVQLDKVNNVQRIFDTTTILTTKFIEEEQEILIPFSFQLPISAALSSEHISYRFNTRLFFDKGVISEDQDIIQIVDQISQEN